MTKKNKIIKPQFDKGKHFSAKYSTEIAPEQQHPVFALYYMDTKRNFCINTCGKDEKAGFANTLYKLSQLTWAEILRSPRHGSGYEKISKDQLKRPLPSHLKQDVNIIAFRYYNNKPMVGYRDKNIFYIVWVDTKLKLYDH